MAMLLLLLLLPVLAAALSLLVRKNGALSFALAAITGTANLVFAVLVFVQGLSYTLPIELHGFEFVFDAGNSSLFLLIAAVVFFLAALYTAAHFKAGTGGAFPLYVYISLSMVNGALLAGHLALMLLFWEGLLCTLFGMLVSRNYENSRALRKGFTLSGVSDLILMLGVAATMHAAHTGVLSEMSGLNAEGIGALGAICLLLGALGKAGSFPFHAWIPDAAEDAPAPFAAAFPGVLYAVLGGYLAFRTASGIYAIPAGSPVAVFLIIIGLISLFGGAGLSLKQANFRRAVSCIGIAQAGMIALGLGAAASGVSGAALQVGVGALGILGLQMVAGAVERKGGSADVKQPGMLWRKMPVEAATAAVLAASLAGFPFLGGFFASASTLHALGVVPAILVLCGQFVVVLALIRLVRAAFFSPEKVKNAKKTSGGAICTVCGVAAAVASLLLSAFHAALLFKIGLADIAGFAKAPIASAALCAVVALAMAVHMRRKRKGGSTRRPILRRLDALEARGTLDSYNWLMGFMGFLARVSRKIEDGVSWLYDVGIPSAVKYMGNGLSRFDNGSLPRYLTLAVVGMLVVGVIFAVTLL